MNHQSTHRGLHVLIIWALPFAAVPGVFAQSNSKGPNSPIVVGILIGIDDSRTKFTVQAKDHARELSVGDAATVEYVGFPNPAERKPTLGFGVKARVEPGGKLRSVLFTPPIPQQVPLGEERLTLTDKELFRKVDRNADGKLDYVEFRVSIYHSPKHGPDRFRKGDRNSDGAFDEAEFKAAVADVPWRSLSRLSPEQWMSKADANQDRQLDAKEFAVICASGNHLDAVFKRTDADRSGTLDLKETTAYLRRVTHGESKTKRKNK